nr:GTP-binding protein [Haloferax elongans]
MSSERFHGWLRSVPESDIRVKGNLWVTGRDRYALDACPVRVRFG